MASTDTRNLDTAFIAGERCLFELCAVLNTRSYNRLHPENPLPTNAYWQPLQDLKAADPAKFEKVARVARLYIIDLADEIRDSQVENRDLRERVRRLEGRLKRYGEGVEHDDGDLIGRRVDDQDIEPEERKILIIDESEDEGGNSDDDDIDDLEVESDEGDGNLLTSEEISPTPLATSKSYSEDDGTSFSSVSKDLRVELSTTRKSSSETGTVATTTPLLDHTLPRNFKFNISPAIPKRVDKTKASTRRKLLHSESDSERAQTEASATPSLIKVNRFKRQKHHTI